MPQRFADIGQCTGIIFKNTCRGTRYRIRHFTTQAARSIADTDSSNRHNTLRQIDIPGYPGRNSDPGPAWLEIGIPRHQVPNARTTLFDLLLVLLMVLLLRRRKDSFQCHGELTT
eukprot:3229130-Rhodomonas_salina.2